MGWECSSYYFCRLTEVFIRYLREPLPNSTEHTARMSTSKQLTRPRPYSRRYLRNSRWKGARLLPYMDDFLFFCRQQICGPKATRPRRVPTRPPRARTQLQERPPGAYISLRAPRPPHRDYNLYLPSPHLATTRHCNPRPDRNETLYTRRPMATSHVARSTRWKSTIPLPRHPCLHIPP
jgi:hypothetical protein